MSVKRFVGATSRDAMRQVRAVLGEEALVLSNRNIDEGVEILALAGDAHGRMLDADTTSAAPTSVRPTAEPPPTPDPTPREAEFAAFSARVLDEMQDLRTLLTGRGREPAASLGEEHALHRLRRRLLGAGFGQRLVAELHDTAPAELFHADDEAALAWARRQLASRLPVLEDETALLDGGGVFALVGPTGIGKTTTTAKLAARYVMRHGPEGVALVTTDSYRIGAHEQLRIYARLLGVEVHALAADAPLGDLLSRLAGKRLVIIDTVGMSQRDQRLAGQIAMLGAGSATARPVRRLLLLNAASHGDTLEEVVETYQRASRAAGAPLFGAILTKVDEAPRLGAVLDIALRHGLKLHYVSHGQQVPEDLRLADRDALVEQALSVAGESSFAAEATTAQGAAPRLQALSRGLLGQGRALAAALDTLRAEIAGFDLLEQAWPLLGYPLSQQRSRLPRLLDPVRLRRRLQEVEPVGAVLWALPGAVSGGDWAMPSLCLNPEGRMLALPWLSHRLPTGEPERFYWAETRLAAQWHLLPRCPGAVARAALARGKADWLAMTTAATRVYVDDRRHTLGELDDLYDAEATRACRYRGRDARLALSRLPVMLSDGEALTAWLGVLRDADDGRLLGQRYWLTPRRLGATPEEAMVSQLVHDDLASLTRRAWQRLEETGGGQLDAELRLVVAAGVAAVAARLDQERSDWAMDVRAQLLGSLGGRRTRSATALLDALLHLFTAREVFLLLGQGDVSRGAA